VPSAAPVQLFDNYARYHQQLDKFADKNKQIVQQQELIADKLNEIIEPVPFKAAPVSPGPIARPSPSPSDQQRPTYRNHYLNDYLRRKKEFELNKARGKGLLNNPILARSPSASPAVVKRDEKEDYEEKLKKVRLKNYYNRKLILNQSPPKLVNNLKKKDAIQLYPENRLKRVAALKVVNFLD
jgi:hypothetical protein